MRNINGSHIIFQNNSFDSNIGTYGGAILIDNRLLQNSTVSNLDWSPFVYLKKNNFTRNTAYIEGNSVYIRGASQGSVGSVLERTKGLLQVEIDECNFQRNYGINVGFGSAVSINGRQDFFGETEEPNTTPEEYVAAKKGERDTLMEQHYPTEVKYGRNGEFTLKTYPNLVSIKNSNFAENMSGISSASIKAVSL